MEQRRGIEPLGTQRFVTEWIDGAEWLVVRVRKNWFVLVFLGVWLTFWTLGGGVAISAALSGRGEIFILFWLVGWAVGWVFAASTIAWQFTGRTMLRVGTDVLEYRWSMTLLARTRNFDVRQILRPRAGPSLFGGFMQPSYPPFLPSQQGGVRFDYGVRTITIATGLQEAENSQIADWIGSRLPHGG